MTTIRLYGISDDSIVDGPGIRLAIFTQGCKHCCAGCHNPEAQPFEGGNLVRTETLLDKVEANPLIAGITLTGGEPFDQAAELIQLAKSVREKGLTVWAYSGYLFEDLKACEPSAAAAELLDEIDVLVDGPFKQDLKSLDLKWRGSSNQRIIDVPASLKSGQVIEFEGLA